MSWQLGTPAGLPSRQDRGAGWPAAGNDMIQLFAQMALLPLTMMASAMEVMVRSLQQVQSIAGREAAALPGAVLPVPAGDSHSQVQPEAVNQDARPPAPASEKRRENVMLDTSLSDDMVKLVEYSIVWIKRDEEDTIAKGEMVVADNLSDDAFAAWVIARYFQKPDHKPIAEDDKKYLRVCYQVKCRWAKVDRQYERRQLEVLAEIRDAITGKGGLVGPASSGPAAGPGGGGGGLVGPAPSGPAAAGPGGAGTGAVYSARG